MKIDIFTLFPEVFPPYLETSIAKRAAEAKLVDINLHNIRHFAADKHKVTDDEPYGGGGGMVMKPEPIFAAVESVLDKNSSAPIILLSPQGRPFDQQIAQELSQIRHIALICGRYEGVDERIRQHLVTDEISIGDYVLTGGELPALVLIDSVIRLIPGALGNPASALKDSFATGLLEHPHYTRPPKFRNWEVPEVLRSGDHSRIEAWRRQESIRRTHQRRPDLLEKTELSQADKEILESLLKEDYQ